jgi:hypothetical protein
MTGEGRQTSRSRPWQPQASAGEGDGQEEETSTEELGESKSYLFSPVALSALNVTELRRCELAAKGHRMAQVFQKNATTSTAPFGET